MIKKLRKIITGKPKTIVDISYKYAKKCHKSTNHRYDNHPYTYHLKMVVFYIKKYSYLIPENDRDIVISAGCCHDTIEDTRQTFNNVCEATNKEIALLVYAVTNEKGKTRKERANKKYYEGIRNTKHATILKCCDRLANINYSKKNRKKNTMFDCYYKEQENFKNELYKDEYKDLFDEMEFLLQK
jgi:(p)ppGpp synthase/HD superfamily hydrolase